MSGKFNLGETVICSVSITNQAGVPVDPATSIKITIREPGGNNVADIDMVKDSMGKYHYDFNSVDPQQGVHNVYYKDVDGERITIVVDDFEYV